MLLDHDDLTSFLHDQMLAIKTIISDEDDSDEGPQIQYDSAAYKSFEDEEGAKIGQISSAKRHHKDYMNLLNSSNMILEEEESKETSMMIASDQKYHKKMDSIISQEIVHMSSQKKPLKIIPISCASQFSSISTNKAPKPCVKFSSLYFKKSVFEPKMIYKNGKYTEWLNFETKFGKIISQKCFKTGNKVKRRRRDSEFASRQWAKNNGLSSMSLSKSMNYDSIRQQNED